MSADPDAPADPTLRSGGYVIKNMIYDGSTRGQLEVISHWRAYEGIRNVEQFYVPPYQTKMPRDHPCWQVNRALGVCCEEKCDPEMMLAGRSAMCSEDRKKLMQCLVKVRRETRENGGKPAWKATVAEQEGTWGAWIRDLFSSSSASPSIK